MGHGYPRKGHVRANPALLTKREGGKTAPPSKYPARRETRELTLSLASLSAKTWTLQEWPEALGSTKNGKRKSQVKGPHASSLGVLELKYSQASPQLLYMRVWYSYRNCGPPAKSCSAALQS